MEPIKQFEAIEDERGEEYRVGVNGVTEIIEGWKGYYPGCYLVFKGDFLASVCYPTYWKAEEKHG